MYTLTYQSLVISYENPKSLGNKMRDLIEQGVNSVNLTPIGMKYTTGRISLYFGSIGYQHHTDKYPPGVTATGKHSMEVNTEKMHELLGSDPKQIPPKPKPFHRTWMTPEEYQRQKAENPTIGTILL